MQECGPSSSRVYCLLTQTTNNYIFVLLSNRHLNPKNWLIAIGWFSKNTIHTWRGTTTFLHKLRPNIDNEIQSVSQPCTLLTVVIHLYYNGKQHLPLNAAPWLAEKDFQLSITIYEKPNKQI